MYVHIYLPTQKLLTEVHSPDQLNEHAPRCFIFYFYFLFIFLFIFHLYVYVCIILLFTAVTIYGQLFVLFDTCRPGSTHVQTYHKAGSTRLFAFDCTWLSCEENNLN